MPAYDEGDSHAESEDSFFVSMTDIMVGLLFVFIILLVYFVLQVRIETIKVRAFEEDTGIEVTQRTQLDVYRTRVSKQQEEILKNLQSFFESEGFTGVTVDTSSGVLRFPDGVLFGSGEYQFEKGSETAEAVRTLADAFAEVLPCSVLTSDGNRFKSKKECRRGYAKFPNIHNAFVESIYIEGHTDSISVRKEGLRGDPKLSTNLKLSTRRATNTYEKVMGLREEIKLFHGLTSVLNIDLDAEERSFHGIELERAEKVALALEVKPALAVSGYGAQRPIADNISASGRRTNRRIDVRIVMYRPFDFDDLALLIEKLNAAVKEGKEDVLG
ncbi:hypothetical protein OAL10_02300 [Gammaproteobacteria bacterium]|nr:hypothetical protein [Gammaproteobacteria bacterium]